MDMSQAALPPRSASYTKADEQHARFGEYRQYVTFCQAKMIDAPSFRDWLSCKEAEEYRDNWAAHPRFKEWQQGFVARRGGAGPRQLPNGQPNSFPTNFQYWLETGRYN